MFYVKATMTQNRPLSGSECGAKAENEIICSACGKKTAKGKFCMECGTSLILKCSKCGAEIPNGAKFCLECGEKF